ncbi:MAG: low molecular weight phosphatase family protein [Bifidobacteriaceae bacterium]|nr:low molecular weight phosphatase family protein [Bifidobacteriaceae bacterium]
MNILFVCTGNLCRSPMGELLTGVYLAGTSVTVSSAGTRGLAAHVIDPNSARVLEEARILWNGDADASLPTRISPAAIAGFRSQRLTLDIAADSDLILCFENRQIEQVTTLYPGCVRRVFLLTQFARICSLCAERGLVTGWTVADRLRSIIDGSPLVMPLVQSAGNIADPIGQDLEHFKVVGWQTNQALREIFGSLAQRKTQRGTKPGRRRT